VSEVAEWSEPSAAAADTSGDRPPLAAVASEVSSEVPPEEHAPQSDADVAAERDATVPAEPDAE
jgi:hypothetical protein